MKPPVGFYVGLGIFFVAALVLYFVGIHALGQYVWNLLHGLSRI